MEVLPRIAALATALPPRVFTQEEVFGLCGYQSEAARQLFRHSGVERRHLWLEKDTRLPETTDELAARYATGAVALAQQAARACLDQGGVARSDVGLLVVASCTGYLCPGLSARVAPLLGLPPGVQRADLLGMGCSGALPALQRGADYVRSHPGRCALVVAVEVCSAAYYLDDSLETTVANAICADGAAAVLLGTVSGTGPAIAGFASHLAPEHAGLVGFEQRDGRLRVLLSKEIRHLAGPLAVASVGALLAAAALSQQEIGEWIVHPGGPKVLDNVCCSLSIGEESVQESREVLRECGNLSSPTVLFVLDRVLARRRASRQPGWGVSLALGPGMSAESMLLHWDDQA